MTNTSITFDGRSIIRNGERLLILSGEVQYIRAPHQMWPDIVRKSREAGLNTLATYVVWSLHEPERGAFDFSGDADLEAFLRLCSEEGMNVILRMGPYCCGEWNFGGFPSWLRDEPGVHLRTWNEPYMARVKLYFTELARRIRPHLATHGGPIVLAQVENEYASISKRYGLAGQRYVDWIVNFVQQELEIDVPLITCQGAAIGAIECINGFSAHERAASKRKTHPTEPLLWTEHYPGWYTIWGRNHKACDAYQMCYETLRFLIEGGTGFNYYVWFDGANFGRTGMYLQATAYDLDAPLDQWGNRTPKCNTLASLHHVLREGSSILLNGDVSVRDISESVLESTWRHEGTTFSIYVNSGEVDWPVMVANESYVLPSRRGLIVMDDPKRSAPQVWRGWSENGAPVYGHICMEPVWTPAPLESLTVLPAYQEPEPYSREDAIIADRPLEQLSLTKDKTDYCWYLTEYVAAKDASEAELHITRGCDYFYVYLNDKLVARTRTPLNEERGRIVDSDKHGGDVVSVNPLEDEFVTGNRSHEFQQRFKLTGLRKGINKIAILSCALGMIKGDWMIGAPMEQERKGIWEDVLLDGAPLPGPWTHIVGLAGEALPTGHVDWPGAPGGQSIRQDLPVWRRMDFRVDPNVDIGSLNWAFDVEGFEKGMIWLNGMCLGRYWNIVADGFGPWPSWRANYVVGLGDGEPTQRFYYMPEAWMKPTEPNSFVMLCEPGKSAIQPRLVVHLK